MPFEAVVRSEIVKFRAQFARAVRLRIHGCRDKPDNRIQFDKVEPHVLPRTSGISQLRPRFSFQMRAVLAVVNTREAEVCILNARRASLRESIRASFSRNLSKVNRACGWKRTLARKAQAESQRAFSHERTQISQR